MSAQAMVTALLKPPDSFTREVQKATIYSSSSRKLMRPLWMTTRAHRLLCAKVEADPAVKTYNERVPKVAVPTTGGKATLRSPRLVSMAHDGQVTIHTFDPGLSAEGKEEAVSEPSAWASWAMAHGFSHKEWTAKDLYGFPLEEENLFRLLPYVCNPAQPVDLIVRAQVLNALQARRKCTLHMLVRALPELDEEYVKAAVAALILDRQVHSDIGRYPLSVVTELSVFDEVNESPAASARPEAASAPPNSADEAELPVHEDTRFHRHLLSGGIADRNSYSAAAVDDAHRAAYERNLNVLVALERGARISEICKEHKISKSQIYYLKDRWNRPDRAGNPLRYRALGKFVHAGATRRNDLSKLTRGRPVPGAYQALLIAHPALDSILEDWAVRGLQPGSKIADRRPTSSKGYEIFQSYCSETLGIRSPHYPFCSKSNARETFVRDCRTRRARHKQLIAQKAHAARATNPWFKPDLPPTSCYVRAQIDGWHADVEWVIKCPSLRGEGELRIRVPRLWILPILEVKSTAVLGYSVAFGENYESADVVRSARSCLVPWVPRKLTSSRLAYKPGEGLPNGLIPELAYVVFDELHLDNASSHKAEIAMTVAQRVLGCTLVFGAPGEPNARPEIELLFDLLAEAFFHVIPGTTGANPLDPRRMRGTKEDPLVLDLELLLDCVDVLICRYNAAICPGTSDTRLKVLERVARRETTLLRKLPLDRRASVLKYDVYATREIGEDKGKPILRFENADYDGPGLKSRPDLVGKEVLVACNSLDPRVIEAFLTCDGSSLGLLTVERRFQSTPVSLAGRRQSRRHSTYDGFNQHAADLSLAVAAEMEARYASTRKGGSELGRHAAMVQQSKSNPHAPTMAEAEAAADAHLQKPAPKDDTKASGPVIAPVPLRPRPPLTLVQPAPVEGNDALKNVLAKLGATY